MIIFTRKTVRVPIVVNSQVVAASVQSSTGALGTAFEAK